MSVEQAVAAPFATRQLADLGARVVKIERPGDGDFARRYDRTVHGQSSYFVWLNRSKESVTLDLKAPAGREVLERLLARADVFVHNLAPGAMERLGFGADAVTSRFERLIPCTITGYGTTGPWAERKAYDLLVQAEAGLLSITGTADAPARPGISVADIAAGMYAYSGILTALLQRATTGRVSAVEVSLFDALAEWMGAPAYFTRYGGVAPARIGAAHATIAPYGTFPTADDPVLIAIQNEREWIALCRDVLDDAALAADPRFVDNPTRVAHRAELDEVMSTKLKVAHADDVVASLDRAGIANARLRTVSEFVGHPVLVGRGRWQAVSTPYGPIEALLPPAELRGVEPRMGPIPAVGEHTEAVLRELGLGDAEIEQLRSQGTV